MPTSLIRRLTGAGVALAATALSAGLSAPASGVAAATVASSTTAVAAKPTNAVPVAKLTLDPATGAAPLRVTADGSGSTDDVAVTSYAFQWGDGSTPTGPEVSSTATHVYDQPGYYTVRITVSDGQRTATSTAGVRVTAPTAPLPDAAPTAKVAAGPDSGASPLTVDIDASGSSDDRGIAGYAFDFGDGSQTVRQPAAVVSHRYETPGTYTLKVTVTDSAGQTGSATTSITATAPAVAEPAAPAASSPTTVSLTFDDTFAEQAAALDALHQRGLKATLYVNSPRIGTSGYLSKAQLDSYAAQGTEIAGHTLGHVDLATATPEEARKQVCNDRVNLLQMGYRVTSLAYPFGAVNPAVTKIAQDCGYNSGRGVAGLLSPGYGCTGCPTAESLPAADPWIIRTPQSIQSDTTLDMLKNYVTQAETNGGGWVPLIFHHVCSGCASNAIDLATFTQFVDWLQNRPASTQVKTVQQVVGGDLKPGVPYVPTSSEVTSVTAGGATRAVDATNIYRGTNMLVLYTPAKGATTGTNVYGTEVAVVDGKVTRLETSIGNMSIPSNGFVLSGNGTSNTWLRTYAKVGTSITLGYGPTPTP